MRITIATPDELVERCSVRELAEHLDTATIRLVPRMWKAAQVDDVERLHTELLEALAVRHAILFALERTRWLWVRDSLRAGCAAADVAEACGMDISELAMSLLEWANEQRRSFSMSEATYASTIAVINGIAR